MKRAIPFLFLLACSSSSPDVASTSAAGAGGAAGDMSGLFGGHGGSSFTLVDGGEAGAVGSGGGAGTAGGAGSGDQDAGPDAEDAEVGGMFVDGSVLDAGGGTDPECEGIELPNADCRCAGFELRAYFFCPGPESKAGAVASCFSVPGFDLIGNVDTVVSNPVKVAFVRDLSGETVWMHGTGNLSTPPYTQVCYVITAEGSPASLPVACSELHAYVCEEKML